ncbi:fasciclin domain-containing protein [Zunongwangia endophytica]|uniref:Fasciclin domain-containing protein n=1 Tax=Zunongwangia endophytica TaxID=1808945 RepID=A0ABV8H7K5_9FLAO|nr:fasciclin domain-containing protein [Zunongwangia endophytica]MDN3596549.1 fasciclin domain-containing protein [Zunongwangia endophytica]
MKNILFLFVVFFSLLGCKKMKQHQHEIVVEEVEEEESVADERQEQQNEELQESRSIAVLIAENAEFTDFHFLLQKADLATNLLENHGPYTVFIPTNGSLESSEVDNLDDKETAEFAKYYILNSSFSYEDLKAEIGENKGEFFLENSLGSTLQFAEKEDGIYLKTLSGDFMKVEKYTEASNGYLYKIEVNN